jgi:hypothetical protein
MDLYHNWDWNERWNDQWGYNLHSDNTNANNTTDSIIVTTSEESKINSTDDEIPKGSDFMLEVNANLEPDEEEVKYYTSMLRGEQIIQATGKKKTGTIFNKYAKRSNISLYKLVADNNLANGEYAMTGRCVNSIISSVNGDYITGGMCVVSLINLPVLAAKYDYSWFFPVTEINDNAEILCSNESANVGNKCVDIYHVSDLTLGPRQHIRSLDIWNKLSYLTLINDRYHILIRYMFFELKTLNYCKKALDLNIEAIRYVPNILKTNELCTPIITTNGIMLKYVPYANRTFTMCMAAVKQTKDALPLVPNKIKHIVLIEYTKYNKNKNKHKNRNNKGHNKDRIRGYNNNDNFMYV